MMEIMNTEQLKYDLGNIDLSGMKTPYSKKNPKSKVVFNLAQERATKELGSQFTVNNDLAEFSFYAFPLIENVGIATFVLIYHISHFLLDDLLDKCPEDYGKWIDYLKTKHFPGTGYLEKLWQLLVKVGEETIGSSALDKFLEVHVFGLSISPEVDSVRNGEVTLTDTKLVDLRSIDSGAPHQFYLVLLGAGADLTPDLNNDPNYIGLNKQAGIHVTLINDLYSLRKEIGQGQYKLNYVYVKMKNGNLTAQDSVNEIILEIMKADSMARVYGEKLKERNYPRICRYVDGIYAAMSGNHYWSTVCTRYNQL